MGSRPDSPSTWLRSGTDRAAPAAAGLVCGGRNHRPARTLCAVKRIGTAAPVSALRGITHRAQPFGEGIGEQWMVRPVIEETQRQRPSAAAKTARR